LRGLGGGAAGETGQCGHGGCAEHFPPGGERFRAEGVVFSHGEAPCAAVGAGVAVSMLSLFDEPPGGGMPAPAGVVAGQVNAAEPAIDSVPGDVVGAAVDDFAAGCGERDFAQAVAGSFRHLQERVPGDGCSFGDGRLERLFGRFAMNLVIVGESDQELAQEGRSGGFRGAKKSSSLRSAISASRGGPLLRQQFVDDPGDGFAGPVPFFGPFAGRVAAPLV